MNILMTLSGIEEAEVYTATLSDAFIKKGHKVYIVSDTFNKVTMGARHKLDFNKRGFINRAIQVRFLVSFIRKNDIQIAHAHSGTSCWSTSIACKITSIPLITTVHGKRSENFSGKIFKIFGDYSFSVCENIREHLIKDLSIKGEKIEIIRDGINIDYYIETPLPKNEEKVISIIGELSGTKGEMIYKFLDRVIDLKKYKVRIINEKNIPEKFKKFEDRVQFMEYVSNIPDKIRKSDLIIGSGRVAVEGILSGRPVLVIGESQSIGVITKEKVQEGLTSNFGDICKNLKEGLSWGELAENIEEAFKLNENEIHEIRQKVKKEFDLKKIVRNIEITYQREIVLKRKKDIPILMYHRVIKREEEKGNYETYVTENQFEDHMKILKNKGYETVVFEDFLQNKFKSRFERNKRQVILTFDDGYEDTYKYAFPILKKYGFKAVIYLVSHRDYNKWDMNNINNPEKRLDLMTDDQIKEMQKYGIEFGGQTKSHTKLPRLESEEARDEIFESKETLEKLLGSKLVSFAYPYGELNERVKHLVEEAGYKFAVATDSGSTCFSDDLFEIRRIGIFSSITAHGFKRKIKGDYNFIKIRNRQ